MFSEESAGAIGLRIHLKHQRVCILRKTSSEDHYFIVLSHLLEEVIGARSFKNVYVADTTFYVHWYEVVRLLNLLELAVY